MNRMDPDLTEAINNARAMAAAYRSLKARQVEVEAGHDIKPKGLIRAQLADLRDDIRGIADRAVIDVDALLWILAEEHQLRQHYRRKPPTDMLAKALGRAVVRAEGELNAAHIAATAAQNALLKATRDAQAASLATRIYRVHA